MDVKVFSQGGQNVYDITNTTLGNTDNQNEQQSDNQSISESSAGKSSDFQPVSVKDAKKAADKINKLLEDKSSTHIEYEQDKDFKYIMIMKVVDNDTNKVINEIPSKKILDMVAQFCEMAGLMLDKKA
ncbi:MAG: flagellar protein FlaG [Clostridium sp.]|nr:flagellar protein FlaG [Clostridium sp.]